MMVRKRMASFGYAFEGLRVMLRTQPNAWIHAAATVVVTLAGLWAGLGRLEWMAIVFAVALVWVAEGLNTAIEFLADAAVPDHHSLIKHAKDIAAAAVLIAAMAALLIALLIFWPHMSA